MSDDRDRETMDEPETVSVDLEAQQRELEGTGWDWVSR